MENNIQIFENEQFGKVRTISEGEKILFCASDVAKALGYSNPWDAVKRHCKEDGIVKHEGVSTTTNQHGTTTAQVNEMTFISEGNVYRLISHSKLPAAEKFESWIFDEVLPTIRKHGMYITESLLDNPDLAIAAFTALKEEREKRKALEIENAKQKKTISGQKQLITTMKPKASYCDMVLKTKNAVPITQIAKDYGMSAVKFNKLLHEMKVQYKTNDCWVLYQEYADKGYTKTNTYVVAQETSVMHTYWTQAGRLFLYNLLKEKQNLIPIMEKE